MCIPLSVCEIISSISINFCFLNIHFTETVMQYFESASFTASLLLRHHLSDLLILKWHKLWLSFTCSHQHLEQKDILKRFWHYWGPLHNTLQRVSSCWTLERKVKWQEKPPPQLCYYIRQQISDAVCAAKIKAFTKDVQYKHSRQLHLLRQMTGNLALQ